MTNRVLINKAITVQSVNGSAVTFIQGNQVFGTTNGTGAVRCVWVGNGAVLNGFTLQNGATMANADINLGESGGGVWCASTNAWVLNCVFTHNSGLYYGGGAFSGTLSNCQFTANAAFTMGGGACSNIVLNSTFTGNYAKSGGAASYGILLANCVVSNNLAQAGGGVYIGSLTNCLVAGNNATNAASVFKFTSFLPGVAGNTVSWLSVTNVTYYLQRTTNLASLAAYSSVQSNIVGQPVQTSYLDTNAVGRGPFFYRVAVQQ
jgi:hypothetical protein